MISRMGGGGAGGHHHLTLDWPALVAGLVVGVYWLRVLRMAYRQRVRTGRAGNFIPPEPMGRALRLLWQPVVGVWVAAPLIVGFSMPRHGVLKLLYLQTPLRAAAAAGAILTFAATVQCWRHMGRNWRMGIDPAERTPLIVTGPFAYVRHPIYTLSALLMLFTLGAAPTPLLAGAAVIHIALLSWEAVREEQHLGRVHGEEFERYRATVGRFLPALSRRSSIAATAA
jgi:protein-S-isoprenylcysteine O-methyltransferase Ste14